MRKRPLWQIVVLIAVLLLGAAWTYSINLHDPNLPRIPAFQTFSALGLILLCAALVLAGRNAYRRTLVGIRRAAPAAPAPAHHAGPWFLLGLLLLAGVLIFLEIRQPRYFLRDDSLVGWQPVVAAGMQAIVDGHWPQWDAHQLMGAPCAAVGSGAFTYPPTYLAYGIARWGLGDITTFSDVFCILHLAIGYALSFLACRRLKLSGAISAAAALAFVLSGYCLIAGRSWSSVALAPAVFAPLIVLCLISLARGRASLCWIVCTGLTFGLFYQVGFPQIWLYAMICYVLAVLALALSRAISDRALLQAAVAALLGVGLSLPLLFMQWSIAGDIWRQSSNGLGIERGLASMILPWPLARSLDPQEIITLHRQFAGQIYYSGTLFAAVGLLAFGSLLVLRYSRRAVRGNIWIIIAAVTFVMALGRTGGLHLLLLDVPLIKRNLGYPFRVLPFFNLFLILGAAVIVQRALRRMRRPALQPAVALAAIALSVYGAILCKPAFYYYGFDAYPPLPAALKAALDSGDANQRQQRLIPAGPWFSMRPDWWQMLSQNLASHYGYYSFDGYDPAVEYSPPREQITNRLRVDAEYPYFYPQAAADDPPHAYDRVKRDLQALGVRWVIALQPADAPPDPQRPPFDSSFESGDKYPSLRDAVCGQTLRNGVHLPGIGIKRWQQGEISLYEIPGARPLAFTDDAPDRALPVQLHSDGFDVDTSSITGAHRLILNFTAWSDWRLRADDKPIPIQEDVVPVPFNRLIVNLPAGTRHIAARFTPPLARGLIWGAIVSASALAMGWFLSRRHPNGHPQQR